MNSPSQSPSAETRTELCVPRETTILTDSERTAARTQPQHPPAGPRDAVWIGLLGMWGLDRETLPAEYEKLLGSREFQDATSSPAARWTRTEFNLWWRDRVTNFWTPRGAQDTTRDLLGYLYRRLSFRTARTTRRRLRALAVSPQALDMFVACAAWRESLETAHAMRHGENLVHADSAGDASRAERVAALQAEEARVARGWWWGAAVGFWVALAWLAAVLYWRIGVWL